MLNDLPDYLLERVESLTPHLEIEGDGPIVVWLKSSLRVNENPAVDVGRVLAHSHNLPLLIYQGIDERYPHASLRHHNMLLESSVDLDEGFRQQGLRYVLHVARRDHRPSVMKSFATQASCIITDLFPLPPWKDWTKKLANMADCPIIQVDCHCLIPMPLFGKSVDRPFKFRDATKKYRKKRIQRPWPKIELHVQKYEGKLPFIPIDIAKEVKSKKDRLQLLRQCEIDPTVLPVWLEKGGESAALHRWNLFKEKGLGGYARRRNNAADSSGVSRLSPSFHYGFLSVMKVARETAEIGTKSAEKFLDELLVFREHAWHHVYATDEPYDAQNLPSWARDSWEQTSDDPRTHLLNGYQLEHGMSGNLLWNLCQNSLQNHGELHNNLRMTWGKSFPLWTENLDDSLRQAQRLNDKYALDGRDPSSIAGVQWCHGLFDRPFYPAMQVMGVVRKRDLETHASRLDLEKYQRHVLRKTMHDVGTIVILGAGLAGSFAARLLKDAGFHVIVLDKGRSPGGRSSTRQTDLGPFNHGNRRLDGLPTWLYDRIPPDLDEIESDALIHHWLEGVEVHCNVQIDRIKWNESWQLESSSDKRQWKADGLIVTPPLPQLVSLFDEGTLPDWSKHPYQSTWTCIFSHEKRLPVGELADVQSSEFTLMPGVDQASSSHLIVHMDSKWSRQYVDLSKEEALQRIMQKMRHALPPLLQEWIDQSKGMAHRWRYARAERIADNPHLPRLSFAGDAWSEPVGTAGAALLSAAWATAELLWEFYQSQEVKSISVQSTLF